MSVEIKKSEYLLKLNEIIACDHLGSLCRVLWKLFSFFSSTVTDHNVVFS